MLLYSGVLYHSILFYLYTVAMRGIKFVAQFLVLYITINTFAANHVARYVDSKTNLKNCLSNIIMFIITSLEEYHN